ncbi:hypothetical protein Bca52824_017954 [Brassica carinata]|uniref:Uncharacterized protein n=1 Tax=Brassica carinata TaxID=52824 RepID=A0A8X8AYX0_BRACI|nr:hypothetical protein Bca52824_017954 [Brassica carinata]
MEIDILRKTKTGSRNFCYLPNPQETYSETFSVIDDGNNRIEQDCSKDDIVVFKESTVPLPIPNGVPEYTVEIFNACVSDCRIAEIHAGKPESFQTNLLRKSGWVFIV